MDFADWIATDREKLRVRCDGLGRVIRSLKCHRRDIEVMTSEMSALCDTIDKTLAETKGQSNVTLLTGAFETGVCPTFIDDFSNDNQS